MDFEFWFWVAEVVLILTGVSSFVFQHILGIQAQYGRYSFTFGSEKLWGFPMPSRVAWFLQETPNLIVPLVLFVFCSAKLSQIHYFPNQILFGLFLFHYIYRTLIFPFRIQDGKPTPFNVFLMAFLFTTLNSFIQCIHLFVLRGYPSSWIKEPVFVIGTLLFFVGWFINFHSDSILLNLRKKGSNETDKSKRYQIPRGGMFEYVSGANFLGEIIEWIGFAIATSSIPGAIFAMTTLFTIGPRAIHHHQFYLDHFKDRYPPNRKALIPFIY